MQERSDYRVAKLLPADLFSRKRLEFLIKVHMLFLL